ncbi:MAG: response regulator transcription factor [Gammaproteobacteria bacterium]|nr:response regulator transcription factor [Gammaproteobacteria bacterium]
MTRILIADDHTLFRAGVVKLLQGLAEVEVVAEATSGREAVQLAGTLHPDIVIMDLQMDDLNGLQATTQIHAQSPDIHVIILSMHANEEYVHEALAAGASAYVLKRATPDELKLAIAAVARGGTYLSAAVSQQAIEGHAGQAAHLTPRQKQILRLIAEGKNVKGIALELQLSVKTVESHRAEIMQRLRIPNAAALIRYAARLAPLSNK